MAPPDTGSPTLTLEDVRSYAEIAANLGVPLVDLTMPPPGGSPVCRDFKVGGELSTDHDRAGDWFCYGQSLCASVEIATRQGCGVVLKMAPYSICATPDAFLRLAAEVGHSASGANLNTGHQVLPRHDPALSVLKLGGYIRRTHPKDSDGEPACCGGVDFAEVLASLRRIGHDGALAIEVGAPIRPAPSCAMARAHTESVLWGRW